MTLQRLETVTLLHVTGGQHCPVPAAGALWAAFGALAEGIQDGDMTATSDVTIIGGGIVGLATAYALVRGRSAQRDRLSITVIEKESHWGTHQTGHNSGVIHSGLYYPPGSSKARFARAGADAMYEFCAEQGLPAQRTGKVVVATSDDELPRLAELARRGQANGVRVRELNRAELRDREPGVRGVKALLVPDAGITDFTAVTRRLADLLAGHDVTLLTGTELVGVQASGSDVVLSTTGGDIRRRRAVNCAGLHCDVVRALVYPVPNPAFPFLGVHLTRMLDGSLHVGPNAVLALAREGYRWRDFSGEHLRRLAHEPGLRALAKKYWRPGAGELARSALKPLFVRAARQLVPEMSGSDLRRAEAGVRAQAVRPDGTLVDDFLIVEDTHWVHVLNAPSPAATASLLIGQNIAERVTTALS